MSSTMGKLLEMQMYLLIIMSRTVEGAYYSKMGTMTQLVSLFGDQYIEGINKEWDG